MHINIDNTHNGGENTRSGENTHTYFALYESCFKMFQLDFDETNSLDVVNF